jgi:hypothetical protein
MNLLKLFKKPKAVEPLPAYPKIRLDQVPAASSLIFYGSPGNKATELVGARLYGHKYNPPAFHAALYLINGEFLNVGKTREIVKLESEFKNTRRVDVIVYQKLTDPQRADVAASGYQDTSKVNSALEKLVKRPLPDYSVGDFLRFGFKWFKPSKKDFCSENVVENLNVAGLNPTDHEPYNTAPWDLVEWAEAHPLEATIYTLYEGDVFKQRLGRD